MPGRAALLVLFVVFVLTAGLAARESMTTSGSTTRVPRRAQDWAGRRHPPAAQPAQPAQSSSSAWKGVYALGQARRGAEVARQCAACHGVDLDGSVDRAPTLVGPAFATRWDAWTLGDMFERIVAEVRMLTRHAAAGGTDELAEDRESQDRQQSADVLAYILLANRLPAGQAELPADIELLRRIRFSRR